jgi:hypothetical protein
MTNFTNAAQENKARKAATRELNGFPQYLPHLPITDIDAVLTAHGFDPTEPSIYCGREGRASHQVGPRTFLSLSWYKMDVSGNYELTMYLS